ncbi:hypothetical protein HPB48_009811 [Haemaphysalis longicornis]|uniref:MAP3K HisK-N-like globin domain-containing protein n=1 Tax=Haemaphysalis longicornis TaxID=44386 RepID=A0A9J6H2C5_HAELO|nr:hypothetical protein HPB48_009811 [Haemaphysalis longicornis]
MLTGVRLSSLCVPNPPFLFLPIVPADRVHKMDKPERMSRFASTGEDGSATATSPTDAIPRSPSTFSFGSETSESGMRRCSSGLLSPPVDGSSTDQESGGFYLLKKDSQRRQTILRVLEEDGGTICDIWMSKLKQDSGDDLEQLQALINGFKNYIPEQNKTGLQHTIGKLKQEVSNDHKGLNQLAVALYLFQSAVNEVLRNQSIKPHWMFALDALVMNAAQVASEILSYGQEDQEENELEDAESTSGVSTINSSKSRSAAAQKQLALGIPSDETQRVMDAIQVSEQLYQDLLRRLLDSPSAGVHRPETHRDEDLMRWLHDLGMDTECMERRPAPVTRQRPADREPACSAEEADPAMRVIREEEVCLE